MKFFKSISLIVPLLLIVSILNSCRDSGSPKTKSIQSKKSGVDSLEWPSFWKFGLPHPKDRESQVVSRWYHFQEEWVGGCLVSDSLVTAAKKHNKISDSILSKSIGKNWQVRFEHSVDSLYTVDSTAIGIAKSNYFISNFVKATKNLKIIFNKYDVDPQLEYTDHATPDTNINIVTIHGYGLSHGRIEHLSYLRATVNIKKKKVINIEKTVYIE